MISNGVRQRGRLYLRRGAAYERQAAALLDALRRGGREAEGGGLLNRYTLSRRIVGSNPIPSAITANFRNHRTVKRRFKRALIWFVIRLVGVREIF